MTYANLLQGLLGISVSISFSLSHTRYALKNNLVLDSISDAVSELQLFHQAGGGTICDVTTVGIRCKPEALPQISRESGVNIVTGTGYYIDSFLSEEAKLLSTHEVEITCFTHTHSLLSHPLSLRVPFLSLSLFTIR